MNWVEIAGLILGAVTLEGIVQFFFIKENKKHKQVENVDGQVAVAQHANELLSAQLERSHGTIMENSRIIAEKDNIIEAKNQEIAKLKADKAALCGSLCVHFGCRIREPRYGAGAQYYHSKKEDPNLGGDFASIDTLLKAERASRKKTADESEKGTPETGNE